MMYGSLQNDLRRALGSLASEYEAIPMPQVVLALAQAQCMPTLGEYLEVYAAAPITADDDEEAWAAPAALVF
jgi:hypothetical protein